MVTLEYIQDANEIIIQEDIRTKAGPGEKPEQLSDEEIAYDVLTSTGY